MSYSSADSWLTNSLPWSVMRVSGQPMGLLEIGLLLGMGLDEMSLLALSYP